MYMTKLLCVLALVWQLGVRAKRALSALEKICATFSSGVCSFPAVPPALDTFGLILPSLIITSLAQGRWLMKILL